MLYCKIVSKSGRTPFAQPHDSPYVHICICVHMDMFCPSFFVMGLVFTVFTQANLKLLNSQAWSLWHGVYGDYMSQPPWSCHIISILLIIYMYNWNSLYSFQFWILSKNSSIYSNLFQPLSILQYYRIWNKYYNQHKISLKIEGIQRRTRSTNPPAPTGVDK